jgi:hypothetical protein
MQTLANQRTAEIWTTGTSGRISTGQRYQAENWQC